MDTKNNRLCDIEKKCKCCLLVMEGSAIPQKSCEYKALYFGYICM